MTAKEKDSDPGQACRCSRLRDGGRLVELTSPADVVAASDGAFVVRDGSTQHPRRFYCVCRVCGSRWMAWEEVDIKESETLYHWQERLWNDEDPVLDLEHEGAAIRALNGRRAQRLVAQAGATENNGPSKEITIEQVGSLEWRWTDERGVAHGCRIEGPRLAVWTEDPFGGSGTDYGVSEFLDGRHDTVLPLAVGSQVRQALTTRQGK